MGPGSRRRRSGRAGGTPKKDKYWQCARMRRPPRWRAPIRRAHTNSSRVARSGPLRPTAPGSPTREIARMLEIERQNREPVDESAGSNGPDGPAGATQAGSAEAGQAQGGGGLLRRARRAVTTEAGDPAASEQPAAPARRRSTRSRAAGNSAEG